MEELGQVYARALFESAMENGVLDEIHDQLGMWADALGENKDLQTFFFSPRFSSAEKKDAIRRIIDGGDERFLNFLELLAERHRLPATFRIRPRVRRALARGAQAAPGRGDERDRAGRRPRAARSASASRSGPAGGSS